jgi:hypothetical protein
MQIPLKEGIQGESRSKRHREDTVTLRIGRSIIIKKILRSYHTKGLKASQSSCDSTLLTKNFNAIGFGPWAWNLNFFPWFSWKSLLLSILNLFFFKHHFWECVDWKPIGSLFCFGIFRSIYYMFLCCILWGQLLSPIIFSIRCLTLVI